MEMNKIRVVATADIPYMFPCFEHLNDFHGSNTSTAARRGLGACPRPGAEIEFIQTLLEGFMHLHVHWIRVASYNESWEYLDSGKADMIGFTTSLRSERNAKGFVPSSVLGDVETGIFGKEVDVQDVEPESLFQAKTSFLKTFELNVWLVMIGITALSLLITKFVSKATNFAAIMWFIFLNMLLSVYSNLMAIDLVMPSKLRYLPFHSLDELGELLVQKKCMIAFINTYTESDFPELFYPSDNLSHGKLFHKAMKLNPPLRLPRGDLNNFILQGNQSMCHAVVDRLFPGIQKSFENNHCRIKMIPQVSFSLNRRQIVIYHKLPLLDQQLRSLTSSSSITELYSMIMSRYLNSSSAQACDYEDNTIDWSPLILSKVFSTFFVTLASGFGLTTVVFLVEHLWHRKMGSYHLGANSQKVQRSPLLAMKAEYAGLLQQLELETQIDKKTCVLDDFFSRYMTSCA